MVCAKQEENLEKAGENINTWTRTTFLTKQQPKKQNKRKNMLGTLNINYLDWQLGQCPSYKEKDAAGQSFLKPWCIIKVI